MKATKRFIEDAVEGGGFGVFKDPTGVEASFLIPDFVTIELGTNEVTTSLHKVLLEPNIWQAVGRVRGWKSFWIYSAKDFWSDIMNGKTIDGALEALED